MRLVKLNGYWIIKTEGMDNLISKIRDYQESLDGYIACENTNYSPEFIEYSFEEALKLF